jgi:hypothetical protein
LLMCSTSNLYMNKETKLLVQMKCKVKTSIQVLQSQKQQKKI